MQLQLRCVLVDRKWLGLIPGACCCRVHLTRLSTLPTVRIRTQLDNSEHTANVRGKFRLRIHRIFKERMVAGDLHDGPVEIGCITAGKSVLLQWEWCDRRRAHS